MDYIKNALAEQQATSGSHSGTDNHTPASETSHDQQGAGNWLQDKVNGALGGGPNPEKNEDLLDKAVDLYQEKILGQGAQNNESAAEQFKDEQISDALRNAYKSATGQDFFVKDKEH